MKRNVLIVCFMTIFFVSGCGQSSDMEHQTIAESESSQETEEIEEVEETEETTTSENNEELIDSAFIEGEVYTYTVDFHESKEQGRYAEILVQKERRDFATITVEQEEWGDLFPEPQK